MERQITTIYIVDDDPAIRGALARLMRSAGFAPEVFESVEALLSMHSFAANSCVIADAQMPGGNGLQLPQHLRQNGLSLPVILLTAQDTAEMRTLAKREGISAFFRKPVDDQALIDAIEWAVN